MPIKAEILTFHQIQELLNLPIAFKFCDQILHDSKFNLYQILIMFVSDVPIASFIIFLCLYNIDNQC